MCFGLPPLTSRTRCECMYVTAPACFTRSGVTKMPLITVSHFFDVSAGIRPGKAVLTGFAEIPQCAAIAFAMSTSKPKMAPLDFVISIGGNVGSVQKVSVLTGAARCAAPTPPATASDSASSANTVVSRLMSPPRLERSSLLRSPRRHRRRGRARPARNERHCRPRDVVRGVNGQDTGGDVRLPAATDANVAPSAQPLKHERGTLELGPGSRNASSRGVEAKRDCGYVSDFVLVAISCK